MGVATTQNRTERLLKSLQGFTHLKPLLGDHEILAAGWVWLLPAECEQLGRRTREDVEAVHRGLLTQRTGHDMSDKLTKQDD